MRRAVCIKLASFALLFVSALCAENLSISIYESPKLGKIEYALIKNADSNETVILENGLAAPLKTWEKIIPQISKKATVFAYNRPGYGESHKPQTLRDAQNVTAELREILAGVGLKPPYIMAGFSLGGLYSQYFARRYPEETKALLLIDSTHPKQFSSKGAIENWPLIAKGWVWLGLNKAQKEELYAVEKSGEQILALPTVTKKPITILSAAEPSMNKSELADHTMGLKKDFKTLYPEAKQIWIEGGHNIPIEKPEVILLEIDNILESLRR
ncbi:MAG TPA: alpha/beta fold hydrolase [Campylobacterales bacterium]|nr:alpha/beta fold hydrolase [Campylobacterales bacterium]